MLSTFIKLPFVIKIFVLSIFEWPFYTGFTVLYIMYVNKCCYIASSSYIYIIDITWEFVASASTNLIIIN